MLCVMDSTTGSTLASGFQVLLKHTKKRVCSSKAGTLSNFGHSPVPNWGVYSSDLSMQALDRGAFTTLILEIPAFCPKVPFRETCPSKLSISMFSQQANIRH